MTDQTSAEHLEVLKKSMENSSDLGSWVETLALVIDTAGDESNEKVLVAAIEISEGIENKSIQADASLVLYHRSNAWASLQHIRRTDDEVWRWEQPELVKQIVALRGSIQHPGFAELCLTATLTPQPPAGHQMAILGAKIRSQTIPFGLRLTDLTAKNSSCN